MRMKLELTAEDRRKLQDHVKHAEDARELRRAQALLWLDEGETVSAVASRQDVTRQTVYNWIQRLRQDHHAVTEPLPDKTRSGRPANRRETVAQVIRAAIDSDPRELGYTSPMWTSALLRQEVKRQYGLTVSQRTVTRALRGLDYSYKRPRHVLARRPRTWRQVKGGSYAV